VPKPRILFADDDPETASLLCDLLAREFDVVGVVHDGRALVDAAARLRPDVIVSDIFMPRLDGLSAAARILRRQPSSRIVMITAGDDRALADRCVDIGVWGYVLKHLAGDELAGALHSALRGERDQGAQPVGAAHHPSP
jgi:NarL family two-component system response regulator LiaR